MRREGKRHREMVTKGVSHAAAVDNNDTGISINVPLMLKKRAGWKQVILPQPFAGDDPICQSHQEALVIAIARYGDRGVPIQPRHQPGSRRDYLGDGWLNR